MIEDKKALYDWLDEMDNFVEQYGISSYESIKKQRKENEELYSKSVKFLKSKCKVYKK